MANDKSSGILSAQPLESPSDDGSLKAIRKRKGRCYVALHGC